MNMFYFIPKTSLVLLARYSYFHGDLTFVCTGDFVPFYLHSK